MHIRGIKTYILVVVFGLMLVCPLPVNAADTAQTLTIQEALDAALANSTDLKQAQIAVDQAQINRDDAAEVFAYDPGPGSIDSAVQSIATSYKQADAGFTQAKKNLASAKKQLAMEVISSYVNVMKSYNGMETIRINLEDAKNQKKVTSLAKELGLYSDYDYENVNNTIEQLEQSYKNAQSSYQTAVAELGNRLGKEDDWNPQLTSQVMMDSFARDDLSVVISRAVSASDSLWYKQALLDIEKTKQQWVLQGVSSEMQNLNVSMAEYNYEKIINDTESSIESLYYGIDTLEGQIILAEKAYDQSQKDLKIAQLKYDLGLLPSTSVSGGNSLASAKSAAQKAEINLKNARAGLVTSKAQYCYLIGKDVFDANDWSTPATVSKDK